MELFHTDTDHSTLILGADPVEPCRPCWGPPEHNLNLFGHEIIVCPMVCIAALERT